MEPRQSYDSDVTDAEWQYLEPFVPAAKFGRRIIQVGAKFYF